MVKESKQASKQTNKEREQQPPSNLFYPDT